MATVLVIMQISEKEREREDFTERDTPNTLNKIKLSKRTRRAGYRAHQKQHPPRTLQ